MNFLQSVILIFVDLTKKHVGGILKRKENLKISESLKDAGIIEGCLSIKFLSR